MTTPIAQGQGAGTESQPGQEAPKPQAPVPDNAGLQKRIDELTAKFREQERRANEAQAQVEVLTRPAQAPQPQVQIDPSIAEQVQALMGPLLDRLQQSQFQLQHSMGQQTLQQSVQQLKVPDAVAARAKEIMNDYARRNQYVSPDAARRYAVGEIWEQEQMAKIQADAQRGAFNGHGAPLTSAGAPAAMHSGPTKPANFDSLPPDRQLQWYDQNLGDKPI